MVDGWVGWSSSPASSTRTGAARAAACRAPARRRWRAPQATYLAWLDCRDLGLGGDPARAFRERGRVALGSGPNYGREAGRGFARLNFATSPEILEDAVRRMASVL